MIEDATHLSVLDALARELQSVLTFYNSRASGITDKAELIRIRLEESDTLSEVLRKQRRHLLFMRGDKIEPETHYAEALLVGVGTGTA